MFSNYANRGSLYRTILCQDLTSTNKKGVDNMININNEFFKRTNISDYYITKEGKVANIKTENGFVTYFKLIKQDKSSVGYCRVPLKIEKGKEKKFLVHRLVYETFKGEIQEGYVIDHIDGNPKNNNLENLRVCTQKENIGFCIEKGKFLGNSKFIYIKDLKTNKIHEFKSLKEMNVFLGYSENYTKGMKSTETKRFKENYKIIDVK